MKQLRLALAFTVATLATTSALAASLTMLQFGSFETRAEAEKRLAEISAKHSAFIGKLATSVREVKLPPDNLTVYRTQAGPVESRAAAQSICSQLASAGDECYIVQTAMVAASEAPAVAKAAGATAASAAATATEPAAAALAEAKSEALSAATPSPDLTSKLSTLQPATTRDPLNRAALAGLSTTDTALAAGAATAGTVASAAAVDAAAPEAAQVNQALDEAVAKQSAVEADLADVKKTKAPSRRSFWSRINPFSEAPAETPAESPALKAAPEAAAAPVETVAAATLPEENAAAALPAAAAVAASASTDGLTPAAKPDAPAEVPVLSKAPISLDASPVVTYAEPLPLPPPPAPLKARDRELLAAATKPVIPAPEPIAVAPVTPATALPAGSGSVQVEEARRVPVTSATTAPATQAPVAQAVPTLAPQAIVPLSPSATEGIKALWAQIGPFANNEAALAYWANYRQQHPDFPVVRVRVVSSYQQQVRGFSESWLRVGPVAQAAFVRNLCASLGPENTLRCGMVRDLGTSSPLGRTPGQLPTSRYKR